MRLPQIALLLALAIAPELVQAGMPVKLSSSGICHAPGTNWYERTRNFTSFASIEACLEKGRLPKGSSQATHAAPQKTVTHTTSGTGQIPVYDRDSQFGSWIDEDGDCLNTRHELLAALSTGPISTGSSRCYIRHGRWNDPYTGRIFTEAKDVDIDHMVPLKWAWDHGAYTWPHEKRIAFANDPVNLFVVHAGTNREKGALGPLEWLPPNRAYRCEYTLRFQRIMLTYGLKMSAAEAANFTSLRANLCGK